MLPSERNRKSTVHAEDCCSVSLVRSSDSWHATVDPGFCELGRISFGRDLGSQHRHGALSPVTTFHSTEGHVRCHVFCA